jgi:Tol biopolymer transport system component
MAATIYAYIGICQVGMRRNPEGTISWAPVWAPDGKHLAFVHGNRRQVPHMTMKPDGTGLRQVTRGPKPDFRPDWGARPG